MAPRCDLGVSWGLSGGCACAQCVAMAKSFAGVTEVVVAVCVPGAIHPPAQQHRPLGLCDTP